MHAHAVSLSDTSAAQYEQATIQLTPMQIYNPNTPPPLLIMAYDSLWKLQDAGADTDAPHFCTISAPFLQRCLGSDFRFCWYFC
jgi:hypothetical protein